MTLLLFKTVRQQIEYMIPRLIPKHKTSQTSAAWYPWLSTLNIEAHINEPRALLRVTIYDGNLSELKNGKFIAHVHGQNKHVASLTYETYGWLRFSFLIAEPYMLQQDRLVVLFQGIHVRTISDITLEYVHGN
jgi:hypothetical protein